MERIAEKVSGNRTSLCHPISHSFQFGFSRHSGIISDGELCTWKRRDVPGGEFTLLNFTCNLAQFESIKHLKGVQQVYKAKSIPSENTNMVKIFGLLIVDY